MIRKAKTTDAEAICTLAKSLYIGKKYNLQKGFLVYVLPEKEYFTRIRISKNFYVSENNKQIDGFLMCYDNKTLKIMQNEGTLSHEDGIMTFLNSVPEPYIFGDQIGISRISQEQKLPTGIQLMEQLFTDMKKQNISTIYVAILQRPTQNIKSIQFCARMGFEEISLVINKDNTTWGIYKYSL